MSGALDPKIQQEIIDRDLYATAVLSGNRNFDGRIHPYAKQAFLASPPLVVAYAIAGTIRFDIERTCWASREGKEIRLKDIWPSDEEIDAVVASAKPSSSARSTPDVRRRVDAASRSARCTTGAPEHLHPPPAVLGRRAGR
jgi:aconitate hydratase